MSIPCTKKEVRPQTLPTFPSPKRVRNKGEGGHGSRAGRKGRGGERRRDGNRGISFCCSSRGHNRGKEGGGDVQTNPRSGFSLFTRSHFERQPRREHNRPELASLVLSRSIVRRAANVDALANAYRVLSPRAAVFLTSHTGVRAPTLWFTTTAPSSSLVFVPSPTRFPPPAFYRSALNDRDAAEKKGRGTVFAKNCDDYFWSAGLNDFSKHFRLISYPTN